MATQNSPRKPENWHDIQERINAGSNTNPTLIRKISFRASSAESLGMEKDVAAPTPFSSPQTKPVSATTTADYIRDPASSLSFSSSPPALDLRGAATKLKPTVDIYIPSSSSTLIVKNPKHNGHKVSVGANIQSRSKVPSHNDQRTRSQPRPTPDTRRFPPTSFPPTFYQQTGQAPLSPVGLSQAARTVNESSRTQRKKTTPPVSPRSTPVQYPPSVDVDTDKKRSTSNASPAPTPHDKRGRPKFYDTIHSFTTCPHVCPPASRPIEPDAQPRADHDFYPTRSTQTRSLIPGSCFNCDTQQRRVAEDEVIKYNSDLVTDLIEELTYVVEQLELLSPVGRTNSEDGLDASSDVDSRHMAVLLKNVHVSNNESGLQADVANTSSATADENASTLLNSIPPDEQRRTSKIHLIRRFYTLEARINEIRTAQDDSIRYIWHDYTARWGLESLHIEHQQLDLVGEHDVTEEVEQLLGPQKHVSGAHENRTELSSGTSDDVQIVTVDDASDTDNEGGTNTDDTSLGSHTGGVENTESASTKPSGSPKSAAKTN